MTLTGHLARQSCVQTVIKRFGIATIFALLGRGYREAVNKSIHYEPPAFGARNGPQLTKFNAY
jgi:hypothetical protein